jgi:hypothetical protein
MTAWSDVKGIEGELDESEMKIRIVRQHRFLATSLVGKNDGGRSLKRRPGEAAVAVSNLR